MDALHTLLDKIREEGMVEGHWLGMVNVLIARKVTRAGAVVSSGMTWRDLATLLKKARWDREAVREVGLDPEQLPPRDRQQFWYSAVARAGVDGAAATKAGDELAKALAKLGYKVGPPPGQEKGEAKK